VGCVRQRRTVSHRGPERQSSSYALRDSDAVSTVNGRINEIAADAWASQILFIADPDGRYTKELAALDREIEERGRTAIAVIAASPTPTKWSVNIDPDGSLQLPWLAVEPRLRPAANGLGSGRRSARTCLRSRGRR
jgi:hypothetical protein